MSDTVIEIKDLSKRFGSIAAVQEISFAVARGATIGLLGGNGAGKTTTIGMMLGLIVPSGGTVEILGEDMLRHRHRVLPRLNFSSPYVDFPNRLKVRENLMVFAQLYGLRQARARIDELAADLDLGRLLDQKTGSLSSGQKTRVSVAKALLNRPEILLLDEPTASLDPDTADWVRSYLEKYQRATGASILLASHNMAEVERLCDEVLMMKAGRIVDRGAPAALVARYGRQDLEEVFLDIARNRAAAAQ
ncbi:MAG TPA: ABC transporter ATP-binding protein [Alphaproteobacteria bacterium]|nr:ABC transporter ATP-binding protein [Alphaproteobacteria bacterium]